MIADFCEVGQFSAKKLALFSKTNVTHGHFFAKSSSSFSKKTDKFFWRICRQKYIKNHNICPRLGELSPSVIFSAKYSAENLLNDYILITFVSNKRNNFGKVVNIYIINVIILEKEYSG
jgi:hypothetical protein